jgi:hypothetical protein
MDVEKLSSSYLASTGESEGVDQGDLLVFASHNVAVQLVLFLSREVASGWGGVPGDMSVLERARPRWEERTRWELEQRPPRRQAGRRRKG